MEDEMHMFFLCPFSKAAWFCSPWFIKTEILAATNPSIPDMIQSLLTSGHPQITLSSLYTFLWCLWKSRNDALFARKYCRPSQVYVAANAIIQGSKLDGATPVEHNGVNCLQDHLILPAVQSPNSFAGNTIFCDAAWEMQPSNTTKQAGIGVFIQFQNNPHVQQLHISAMSPPASSPLQAETFGLLIATRLAEVFNIQDPHFLTDCLVLASAAKATDIFSAPGHWDNRPLLAQIQNSPAFQRRNVSHINRGNNVKAHHLARLASRMQIRPTVYRCLCSDARICQIRETLCVTSVLPFTLLSVKCS
nr:uncharacterized protein LOC127325564 [Lolium perenne]